MRNPLLFLALAAALAACSGEAEKPQAAAITVNGDSITLAQPDKASFLKLGTVEKDQGSVLRLPGRLVWNEEHTVRIFPALGGRISRLAADVGQGVKAGQALAELASPDFGLAEADARKARADLQLARQALARQKELHNAGIVADKDWQQAQAEAARAQAEAERAERRLQIAGGGKAEAGGNYVLRSPMAGIVVERNLNPGQEIRSEQGDRPLFVVTDPTSLWVQLDANESDLAALRPGEKFAIEVKQFPGEHFEGVIRHIADFVDPASRTLKVRGELPNPQRRLKGEMFITALIELPPTQALHAPASAVFLQGDKRYVFVQEAPGRYLRREVQAGPERNGWVDILAGLKEGEHVVTEGNLHLLKYFKALPALAAK